ncbi:MAG: gamma-glutamyl-gamma-aminobutyrate hydrolase family protein [Chloroflexi bacterium]|nr:gamma-glutamyl-gamma-aminobutyrate hydrolase family protein [Chloroflexota bacterium]
MSVFPRILIVTNRYPRPEKPPIVGIPETYAQALYAAQAMPMLVPLSTPVEQVLEVWWPLADGLLLAGGGDIDPARFHGQPHPKVDEVYPDRDAVEITLARRAVAEGVPVLAICRGIQVLNVALGGTLYTDIPDQLPDAVIHRGQGPLRHLCAHPVHLEAASRLAAILGTTDLCVNSFHHQGIKDLAPGLRAVAWSECGLIEAVEVPEHPFAIGVQWHPELMARQEHEPMQALFRAFAQAARTRARMRTAAHAAR